MSQEKKIFSIKKTPCIQAKSASLNHFQEAED